MQTITIWVLFQVFPFVQPLVATDTEYTCIRKGIQLETEGVILKCAKIEVLEEFI